MQSSPARRSRSDPRRTRRPVPRSRAHGAAVLRANGPAPAGAAAYRPYSLMIQSASKAFFHVLAANTTLKSLASRYGMRGESGFARRFIAGESVSEAIEAARRIQASGLSVTLDYLGEAVGTVAEANAATR